MISLQQVLEHGSLVTLSQGPLDDASDMIEYLNQGTEIDQENAQALIDAIMLLEIEIIAIPDKGKVIMDHLTALLERHINTFL